MEYNDRTVNSLTEEKGGNIMNRKLISLTMAMLLLCATALNACGK